MTISVDSFKKFGMQMMVRYRLSERVECIENKQVVDIHYEAHIRCNDKNFASREKHEPNFELQDCVVGLIVPNRNLDHFESEYHAFASHE